MSEAGATGWLRRMGAARWAVCFVLALGFHAAGAAVLIARWHDEDELPANAPVITIDLAPTAVAPSTTPTDVPPDQAESKQVDTPDPQPEKSIEETKIEPEPEPQRPPEEKVELPPDTSPKPELAVLPPPKPVEKPKEKKEKPKHKTASLASAPASAEHRADRPAAPTAGANAHNPNAVPNWISQLSAQLERHKRYPSEARGDTGVVQLAFSVDRGGGVHNARVVRSSGSSALDNAALALVARAAPLPPPPPERPGAQIAITVPIRYNAR